MKTNIDTYNQDTEKFHFFSPSYKNMSPRLELWVTYIGVYVVPMVAILPLAFFDEDSSHFLQAMKVFMALGSILQAALVSFFLCPAIVRRARACGMLGLGYVSAALWHLVSVSMLVFVALVVPQMNEGGEIAQDSIIAGVSGLAIWLGVLSSVPLLFCKAKSAAK